MLDQRALPGEERWIRCEPPEQVAGCIRTLAVRGAPAIGIAAAYAMALARATTGGGRRHAARHPPHRGQPRLGARPAAGGRRTCSRSRASSTESSYEADRRLARLGAERFEPGDRALTHCNAGALATGRLRHGRRRAARRLGARPPDPGVGRRDAPALQGARLTA